MKQMGQRCPALNMDGSSDFRKLGHQGKHSVFTDVIVRHPRRRMALDSPDREFAHMTIHTHRHRLTHTHACTHTHAQAASHLLMQRYMSTCDACQHETHGQHEQPTGTAHTRTGEHTNTTCTQPGNPLTSHFPGSLQCAGSLERVHFGSSAVPAPGGCKIPRHQERGGGALPWAKASQTSWALTLITSSWGWGHGSLRTCHTQPQLLAPGLFLGTMHPSRTVKRAECAVGRELAGFQGAMPSLQRLQASC